MELNYWVWRGVDVLSPQTPRFDLGDGTDKTLKKFLDKIIHKTCTFINENVI